MRSVYNNIIILNSSPNVWFYKNVDKVRLHICTGVPAVLEYNIIEPSDLCVRYSTFKLNVKCHQKI